MQNFNFAKLNKHNHGNVAFSEAEDLMRYLCLKAPTMQLYEGSCRAIAQVDLPHLTFLVGTSAHGRHAEEHIAEQYYDLTKATIVTISAMYIDLAPCAGQYSGHKCIGFFNGKGRTVHQGNLHGKVHYNSPANGSPCPIYYLLNLPAKGESANLSALNFGGVMDSKLATEKIFQVWQFEP